MASPRLLLPRASTDATDLDSVDERWQGLLDISPPRVTGLQASVFPVEIFQEIFSYIPLMGSQHLTLVTNVSQVCKHWRHVALQMKSLWTYIAISPRVNIHRVEQALERSYPLPITVDIGTLYSDDPRYKQLVLRTLEQMPRIRKLFIDGTPMNNGDDPFLEDVLSLLTSRTAPLLENFRALCFFELPQEGLFRGETPPNLRSLDLWACEPIVVLLRATLTRLELYEVDLTDILRYLDGLPSLETLIMSVPSEEELDASEVQICELPNLRLLDLSAADLAECIPEFMACLDIPSTASIKIRYYESLTEWSLTPIMTTISSTFSNHISHAHAAGPYFQDVTISSSNIWRENDCGLTLHNPISSSNQTRISQLPEELHLFLMWDSSYLDERGIIPRILSFMPTISTVQRLHVHNQRFSFLQEWLDLAGHVEQLLYVDAEGMAAHGLVMALQQPALPRLATLSLASVTFTHQVDERPAAPEFYHHMRMRASPLYPDDTPEIPEEEPIPEDSIAFIEMLIRALAARATSGSPITHLSIRRCNVSTDMVASLRACLGEEAVDWDGQVDGGRDPNLRHVWQFW